MSCTGRSPQPAPEAGAPAPPAAQAPQEELPAPPPAPTFPPYPSHPDDPPAPHQPIEDVERLDHFFAQLTLTDLGIDGAITRASHWGDSVIGGDGLTGAIRERLQRRFGDAGHGFHALSRYSKGYAHRGVRFQDHGGWESCHIIYRCSPERRYGYAGVSTRSAGGGRSSWATLPASRGDAAGTRVSRFELWYARHPAGGKFQIKVDGRLEREVDTRSPTLADAVETLSVSDGPHSFEVLAAGGGSARGYGVVLERDAPGVVWDELSQIGSFTQRLDHQDAEHAAAQVARRDPDLLVFMLGGNDVQRGDGDLRRDMSKYEREYTRVLEKWRAGEPQAGCLIMSLIDHGVLDAGVVRSRPVMFRLVAAQRKVAREQGCAFFDTFAAMGGEGAIGRWQKTRPPLAARDLIHPTAHGQRQLAAWLYDALMHGYAGFRRRQEGRPLPPLDGPVPLPGELGRNEPGVPLQRALGAAPAAKRARSPRSSGSAPPAEDGGRRRPRRS